MGSNVCLRNAQERPPSGRIPMRLSMLAIQVSPVRPLTAAASTFGLKSQQKNCEWTASIYFLATEVFIMNLTAFEFLEF